MPIHRFTKDLQNVRFWGSEGGEAASSIGMYRSVMPGYLGLMGIPLGAGRDVSDDDIVPRRRVALVDERLSAQLWQGDAIGKRLVTGRRWSRAAAASATRGARSI